MDDFDIEDGSFYNWDGGGIDWSSVPSIDISGVGSIPEYDFSFLDDLIPSGLNESSFDTSFLDDFNFDALASGLDFSQLIGDQPGDFPLKGNYGDPLAPGLKDLVDDLFARNVLNDPFSTYDSAEDFDFSGSYGDPLAPGLKDAVDDLLARNVLNDPFSTYDSPEDYSFEGSYGDPLAPGVKEAVDELFKYNAAIAQGGYPVMNKDGSVTVKDSSGKDLFKVGNDGKITDVKKDGTQPTSPKAPTTPGGNKNAALLAALLGGLLGLATKPKTAGAPRGFQAPSTSGSLTASRQALAPAGAPGSGGGRRFLSDVKYAADGGLMDSIGYQPNQNVLFMKSGGIADLNEYIKMGAGMNAGDLRKADFLVRSGMSPDSAKDGISKVPDGMARGGLSDLGSYSDGGRMLKGPGDGMSDDIPATIGGKRPARLADGEFVVPADVVSHLGNGSTDAGADVLYDMMDKVRKARTGTKKQGKQINPKKYVPK